MSLADLLGEDDLNPHEIAWRSRDWNMVKELCKEFKTSSEQSLFKIVDNVTKKTGHKRAASFADYDQHMINNVLSQHVELSGYAYELNQMEGFISDQQHYDYMYFSIRQTSLSKVKFAKITDDWEFRVFQILVADYYEVSHTRGAEYIQRFSDEQINRLKRVLAPTVDINSRCLLVIPTKTERAKICTAIKNW